MEIRGNHAEAVDLCRRAVKQALWSWRAYEVRMSAHDNYVATYQDRAGMLAAAVGRYAEARAVRE